MRLDENLIIRAGFILSSNNINPEEKRTINDPAKDHNENGSWNSSIPAPKFITGALSTKTDPDDTETWRYPSVIESWPSVANTPIIIRSMHPANPQ